MKARLFGLLAGTAVLALSSTLAQAADLPVRTAPMAPAPVFAPVPVFTWTGAYLGVNAGWGWNDDDNDDFFGGGTGNYAVPLIGGGIANYTLTNPTPFVGNRNDDGFVGGAQIGYNFQAPGSGFVFGVEADIQGVWNDDDDDGFFGTGPTFFGVAPTTPALTGTGFGVAPGVAGAPGNLALFEQRGAFGRNGLDWFSTLRLRAGVAFDRLLVYATGGLAFGEGDNNDEFVAVTGGSIPAPFFVSPAAAAAGAGVTTGGVVFNNDDIRWGWTLGGGVEYAFTNNLTLKLEGLYVNLENDNNFFGTGNRIAGVTNTGAPVRRTDAGFGFNNDDSSDFFVVRGGLNFKFNTF